MSGALFLGASTLLCLAAFLIGLRFVRTAGEAALDPNFQSELPAFITRGRSPAEQVCLFGRVMMVTAPLFWLFALAFSTGLLGPVEGVEMIRL